MKAAPTEEGDATPSPSPTPSASRSQPPPPPPLLSYPDAPDAWPAAMRPVAQWVEAGHMGERVPLLAKLLDLCEGGGQDHPLLASRLADLHPYSW